MLYYIKLKKLGSANWKALREDGKILVFNNLDKAKDMTNNTNTIPKIISISYHPAHKRSSIYGKKYKKIGW